MTPRKAVACQNKTEDIKLDFSLRRFLGILSVFFESVFGSEIDALCRSVVPNGHAIGSSACSQLLIRRCHSVCSVG